MTSTVPRPDSRFQAIPEHARLAAGETLHGLVREALPDTVAAAGVLWRDLPADTRDVWKDLASAAAAAVLAAVDPGLLQPHHIITVSEDSWAMQHPLTCRPNLAACAVHAKAHVDESATWDFEPGIEYVVQLAECGCLTVCGDAEPCEHGSTFTP